MKKPCFLNVVPFFPNDLDYMTEQAIRIADEVGLKDIAFSISLHPQGTPAKVRADIYAKAFASLKEKLSGRPDIHLGILIQSIMGHGWSGPVPLTDESWMHTVTSSEERSSRQCSLDRGFCNYIFDAIQQLAVSKPAFFLVDDDFCSTKNNECYCELHMAEYNKRLGREWKTTELLNHIKQADHTDPVVQVVTDVLDEGIVSFAKEIRAAIDAIAPDIRCGMCFQGFGTYSVDKITLELAGATEPFIRVSCAIYGGVKPEALIEVCRTAAIRRAAVPHIHDIIVESDTFPQTLFSMGSRALNAHVTLGFVNGFNGSKLWNTCFQDKEPASGRAYEVIMKKYMGSYSTLLNMLDGFEPLGPEVPFPDVLRGYHPLHSAAMYHFDDFIVSHAGVFGIPFRYGQGMEKRTRMLAGNHTEHFTDEEIRTFFKGNLLLDGIAIQNLAKRGFSKLMGVSVENDPKFFHTAEISNTTGGRTTLMGTDGIAQIDPADGAVEASTLYRSKVAFVSNTRVAAGLTLFTNELGGRVACFAYHVNLPFHALRLNGRKALLVEALDFLEGDRLPALACNPQDILLRSGLCSNGDMLVSVFNLNMDPLANLELRFRKSPISVERLMPDGSWSKPEITVGEPGYITIDVRLEVYEPGIFRIRF